jgi:hypothetical protein
MKKTIKVLSLVALLFTAGFAFMSMADSGDGEGGRIKVYIVNECSSDVDYKVASPGSSTHYTAADGTKTAKTFQEGTKIYNSDGKMVMEVTAENEGDEVVVCE